MPLIIEPTWAISPCGLYAFFDHPAARYQTELRGINAAGHMVGTYDPDTPGGGLKGFLYINGLCATIDYPSAHQTNAYGINDEGQIVGFCVDSNGRSHGYLLSGGTYSAINYPLARDTFAMGINNNRRIVGTYNTDQHTGGFLYNPDDDTYAAIDYPLADATFASGINDSGQIVGTYNRAGLSHGFVYDPNGGTYTNLDVP